ncbi:MAG: ATP-binding protein, partial [Chloroflexota bacterium]
ESGRPDSGSGRVRTAAGQRFAQWHIVPEKDEIGRTQSALVSIHDVTQLRHVQGELEESHTRLRELTYHLQDVRENELTALARNLHDHFSQSLTAIHLDLLSIRPRVAGDAGTSQKLNETTWMIEALAADVRRLSTDLRPSMLDDIGLRAAIEWQLSQFTERTGIVCEVNLLEDDSGVSLTVATSVFRVFQEVLANIARHASATRVRVNVECGDEMLILTVSDNGRGIGKRQVRSRKSLGILGMKERVGALGGEIAIDGTPGKGTTVVVRVPLKGTEEADDTR